VVLFGLIVALLAGCAAPLTAAPQVMVTRVPLEVATMAEPATPTAMPPLPGGVSHHHGHDANVDRSADRP